MHADRDDIALDCYLPEITVQGEKNSAIGLGPLQKVLVAATRKIITRQSPGP